MNIDFKSEILPLMNLSGGALKPLIKALQHYDDPQKSLKTRSLTLDNIRKQYELEKMFTGYREKTPVKMSRDDIYGELKSKKVKQQEPPPAASFRRPSIVKTGTMGGRKKRRSKSKDKRTSKSKKTRKTKHKGRH